MNADAFVYRDNQLFAEDIAVSTLAERFGTPTYVYSRRMLESAYCAFDDAFSAVDHLVCFAVKANSNIGVLNLLARLGSGFDIVSGGELKRVLKAGGSPDKIVFSGVAKSVADIRLALETNILCFNVESGAELERIQQIAAACNRTARISFRVNPDVDAQTHPYISTGLRENKFGVAFEDALALYQRAAAMTHIEIHGIDCHIGSQLTSVSPFVDALQRVLGLVDALRATGIELKHIDIGGGLGVRYRDEIPPTPAEYAHQLLAQLASRNLKVLCEPGRAISANAGIMITRVEYLKDNGDRHFALVDAGMNDQIRPSLYDAWMKLEPVSVRSDVGTAVYDVVGPVCETGDFLGKERELTIAAGDLLVLRDAGAYGFVMASNYNSRGRPAEVIVDGDMAHLVRQREGFDDLIRGEQLLPGHDHG